MVQPEYVPTGVVAKRLGVTARSVQRWVEQYGIEPHILSPGGHARWDFDRLVRELREAGMEQRRRRRT